jgi:hypothetical protein
MSALTGWPVSARWWREVITPAPGELHVRILSPSYRPMRVEFPRRVISGILHVQYCWGWIVHLGCVGNLPSMRIVTVRCPLVVKFESWTRPRPWNIPG